AWAGGGAGAGAGAGRLAAARRGAWAHVPPRRRRERPDSGGGRHRADRASRLQDRTAANFGRESRRPRLPRARPDLPPELGAYSKRNSSFRPARAKSRLTGGVTPRSVKGGGSSASRTSMLNAVESTKFTSVMSMIAESVSESQARSRGSRSSTVWRSISPDSLNTCGAITGKCRRDEQRMWDANRHLPRDDAS